MLRIFALFFAFLSFCSFTDIKAEEKTELKCSEVKLAGVSVTCLKTGIGPFNADQRANAVKKHLDELSLDPKFDARELIVIDHGVTSDIMAGDTLITSIRQGDIEIADGGTREEAARVIKNRMKSAIEANRTLKKPATLLWSASYTIIALIILLIILTLLKKIFPRLYSFIRKNEGRYIKSIKIKNFEILNSKRIVGVLLWLAQAVRIIISLLSWYIFVSSVLSFFPWTAPWAPKLYSYIIDPILHILKVTADYIPKLFFIFAIGLVTRYLLKLVYIFFHEVEIGSLEIDGFYKDWANPTYKLVRVLIMAFALVMAFPYLPGSNSPAFQGVTVFLGILLSLGSSSAVANIVAGVVLTYMRPFRVGDRVKIADTQGDVIEKNLLVTRIRSIKNFDITIPNSMVLGSHIINFSSTAYAEGLILNTTVTIGYDAPWRKVHELLKEAARRTELISKDKEPFVLQTALNDFFVSYELNAYTSVPNKMAVIYSELHQNIQDTFNEGGIEIMSPHYSALRDGNDVAIPEDKRPEGYVSPSFKVSKI